MKVGIDGVPLTIPFPCGTRTYSKELLKNLADIDRENEYYIFSSEKVSIPKQKNFKFVKIPSIIPIMKRQLFLALYAKRENLDIVHYLEPYGAFVLDHPGIVTTVHDIDLSLTYPILSRYMPNRIHCEIVRYGVFKKTNRFISVSETTKKELKKYLDKIGKSAPIDTIYNGLSKKYKVKSKESSKDKYFMCMGDFTIRKNVSRVIKAYLSLPIELKEQYTLKVIAPSSYAAEKFRSATKDLALAKRVKILENASDKQIVKMYNQASAFIYASLYEGFGMPILEAMACGCPVITSDKNPMKEVADSAALLVNPKSKKDIKKAMVRIIMDKKLSDDLKSKGFKRVKDFSWRKAAEKTLQIYKEVYRSNNQSS